MKKILFLILFLTMSCAAQYQMHDYKISHDPNPPEDQVSIYHYWLWEGDNLSACPLFENQTYEQAIALGGYNITIPMTATPTLISGTLALNEDGFWVVAGVIAENAQGQRSVMAVSPGLLKPEILTSLTKVRSFILERLP